MKIYQCPGQDGRNLKIQVVECENCGYKLEIFSDEIRVCCPRCKALVCRPRLPSCVDWCKKAPECVGQQIWQQIKGGG